MATSQHISIFLFCCNQKNKRRLKIEYQAQKVSLESRILKKKVRGKANTLPLPRTVQKPQSVRAIFTPKSKINGKVKEAGEKASKKPRWTKFRTTKKRCKAKSSRFSQGRKSSRLKSLGRKRPDSAHNGRQLPTVQGVSALSHYQKSVGRFYAYGGGWGVVNIKNALFSKEKQGVTIGVKTKNDKRRWAYGVLEKLEY